MTSKIIQNKYFYKCPVNLGYLKIDLDAKSRVKSAIFLDKIINKKESNVKLPVEIETSLDNYFNNKKDIPLNLISIEIIGTDFQKSIWKVISKVSFSKTISYADMAEKLGKGKAAQAAGTACGKNPLALFIPCHRVVRKQNEDYGYSWGKDRKKWLLDFEKSS